MTQKWVMESEVNVSWIAAVERGGSLLIRQPLKISFLKKFYQNERWKNKKKEEVALTFSWYFLLL